MKISRRKLTLQLTPLLDLMLIVFFMQYLELRQREAATVATATAAEEDVARLREELEASRRLATDQMRMIDELQTQVAAGASALTAAREQAAADGSRIEGALQREKRLGELVAELFAVPEADVDQVLNPDRQPALDRSPQEIAELRERFQQMAKMESGRVIQHLLLYEEIRKRCDVWELFVDPQHVVALNTGAQTHRIRLNLDDAGNPDMARFEEELFALYRSLPEPKSLVVILLTYDRDTRLIVIEALEKALPALTRRLSDDARGKVRFEYADLGIRAGGE